MPMSKPDKAAQRSALKQHMFRGPALVRAPAQKTSWWLVGAQPHEREQFVAAQRNRALEAWTNAAPHAMNPRGNFQ